MARKPSDDQLPEEPTPIPPPKVMTLQEAAGAFRPQQFVDIGNRDAPWHLAGIGWRELTAGGQLLIEVYNSRGFGMSDLRIRAGNLFGGPNAILPVNPSFVWPVNSSLCFDLQNIGAGSGDYALFFYGFKIFDRGKAPC